ncbi:hypothetical protein [Actinoplanes sichuanensis]|uniref:Dynamin family protein n=1 Tax=Actinoplanes sichuanensis TaxID=512349 RepID=A0ABW4AJZ1_9ACTN|nr:hypothetical protein [Actinoplanes sichuanensis]
MDNWRAAGAGDNSIRKDSILKAERFAADVLSLTAGVEVGPALIRPLARVDEQARRQLALIREPYKVGVIGEYGAGKTLFVASLLNYLEDLPIGDLATTGNVTRFRLRPVTDGERTVVAGRRVVFLSRTEVERCLEDLAQQVRDSSAVGAGLDDLVQKAIAGDPEGLRAWLATERNADNALIRLATQVIAVADSAARYPAILGTTRDVADTEVAELLRITADRRPTADPFWLVRQMELVLDVPVSVLDLTDLAAAGSMIQTGGGIAGGEFGAGTVLELWDFPGISNGVSYERDRRLTRVLLHDVDSAIALLKAGNPDSPAPDELKRLIEATGGGAIAGIGNVFDSAQAGRLDTAGLLDSEAAVFKVMPTLDRLLQIAGTLTPDSDPFVYAGLVAYQNLRPQPDTSVFDHRLDDQAMTAMALKKIVLGLPADSALRAQLLPATEDGGRRRVLALLAQQLSAHGLYRRWQRVQNEDARLRELVAELEAAVERTPEDGGVVAAAEKEFELVISALREALERVKGLARRVLTVELSGGGGPGEISFTRYVEETTARQVNRWPQWRQMLDAVHGREIRGGPQLTDELAGPFGETCAAVLETVRAEALRRWESALLDAARAALTAGDAAAPTPDLRLLSRVDALAATHGGRWTVLAQPNRWRGMLTNVPASVGERHAYQAPSPQQYAESFPLPYGSRFVWAYPPDHGRDPDDADLRHRVHPGYVFRLRHEMVATTVHLVEAEIEKIRGWAAEITEISLARLTGIAGGAQPPETRPGVDEARAGLLEMIRRVRQSSPEDSSGMFWNETERDH